MCDVCQLTLLIPVINTCESAEEVTELLESPDGSLSAAACLCSSVGVMSCQHRVINTTKCFSNATGSGAGGR